MEEGKEIYYVCKDCLRQAEAGLKARIYVTREPFSRPHAGTFVSLKTYKASIGVNVVASIICSKHEKEAEHGPKRYDW